MDEQIKILRQMLLEVHHAQTAGPGWYTRGEDGLYQQVSMWIEKSRGALDKLSNELVAWEAACKNESRNCSKHQRISVEQGEKIAELKSAIREIAPWLSASLEDHEHDGKGEYLKACNEIFRLDQEGKYNG